MQTDSTYRTYKTNIRIEGRIVGWEIRHKRTGDPGDDEAQTYRNKE